MLVRSHTYQQLRDLKAFLPRECLQQLKVLVPLSIIPGIIDLASVGVIARLMSALVGGDLKDALPGVRVFGGDEIDQSLWLILIFAILSWLASLSKLGLQFFQQRLTARVWVALSNQIYANVIAQGYEYHLTKSTAKLSSMLLSHIKKTSNSVVTPLLKMVSSVFTIALLSAGVLVIGKGSAVMLIVALIGSYLVLSQLITPYLRHASKQKIRLEARTAHVLLESLGSIRDIKLTGSENYFRRSFVQAGEEAKAYAWSAELLPIVPRMLIEPLGITLIFAIGAVPALVGGDRSDVSAIIPFLASLAFAALRLTPPLQDFFQSMSQLRGGLPVIEKTLEYLSLPAGLPRLGDPGVPSPQGVLPNRTIGLHNVWYAYPSTDRWVLQGIDLTIPVGSRVAFVGSTGSGKTTTAQILLALLKPSRGVLTLDGIPVSDIEVPSWQACCSQVPQFINLLDASVLQNVAFGQDDHDIDQDAVWGALEAAQLDEYVSELPYGIHTPIGENGLQLSGGQRQRLALARSFYRGAQFLLLDEATSALDNRTENEIIQALEVIGRRCTTVVIAHRLSTVMRCDRIYEFENGRIIASGTFEELQKSSSTFRDLAVLDRKLASG
ncbi:MAG: ABC transporter ATP-binding protein [Cyanobacteria bacterium K_DeepCast_35m_m1_288]|nr:ABC transporter ATP-binding protein [Cyanobacteria bacterium K_DeepCast_35m_m1_288]